MLVQGELKCLHCGYISGSWIGQGGTPLVPDGFRGPDTGAIPRVDTAGIVHCSRCLGPVFLDEVSPVISATRLRRIQRLRAQIAAIDARKRRAA